MPDYTVTAVHGEPEKDTYGNVSYFVTLEGIEKNALLKHKGDRPLRKAGDVLQGYKLEEKQSQTGNSYLRLFREQNGNQGGGVRPEDPARAKRIMRQHSQEMALRYATIRHAQGKLPDTFSLEDLFKIADRFDADGQGAAA